MTMEKIDMVKTMRRVYVRYKQCFGLFGSIFTNCPSSTLLGTDKEIKHCITYSNLSVELSDKYIDLIDVYLDLYKKTLEHDEEYFGSLFEQLTPLGESLYQLNMAAFNEILIGYDLIEIHYLNNDDTDTKEDNTDNDDTDIMNLLLSDRMDKLGITSYQEFYNKFPTLITDVELKGLIDSGLIETQDDILKQNGEYHENEFSEDWEDFEYQFEDDRRKNR